jgi:hypothetical protein
MKRVLVGNLIVLFTPEYRKTPWQVALNFERYTYT